MQIIALDDEELALKLLAQSIREACPSAQVDTFRKASDALNFLGDNACDVAFLDIQMRGIDGLTLAKRIKELQPKCNLIFVTGFSHYATDALSLHASGYIMKPVNSEKISKELADLRHPLLPIPGALLKVRCFGNFDVFTAEGLPIKFGRAKSKELFAYLVYRKGASCTSRELAAVLFEDNEYSSKQMTYLQKIISSMMQTLKEHNADSIIHKSYNAISLDESVVDCDYYRFLQTDPSAINTYAGEFMTQYSWAEFVAGYLDRITSGATATPL